MGGEWSNHRLADVIELIGGGTPKRSRSDYWGGDIPWLSVKDFNDDYRHVYSAEETITEDGLNNSSTKILEAGEIIISARGTVGALAQLARPMAFNQSCYGINAKSEFTFNDYLFYLLRYTVANLQRITHGAVFDTITRETFQHVDITLPSIPEQRAIAHILGTLDDKIELNRQMNKTLEAMAQALFKSWFIDFDPVVVNALRAGNPVPDQFAQRACLRRSFGRQAAHYRDNPRALSLPEDTLRQFPDRFQDSELGPIPEGWGVQSLDDIATFLNGLACQKYPAAPGELSLPVIKIRELRQGISGNTDRATTNVPEKYIVHNGDVLFSWSGSLLIDIWTQGKGVLNQHVFKVSSENYPKWFYFHWLDFHLLEFQRIAADKATTMGHIKRHHLADAKVIVPDSDIMKLASAHVSPIFDNKIENAIQARSLATLRDILLPKLISGELRLSAAALETLAAQAGVPDVEKLLEEAI